MMSSSQGTNGPRGADIARVIAGSHGSAVASRTDVSRRRSTQSNFVREESEL